MKIDLIKIDEMICKLVIILGVIIVWLAAIFVGLLYIFNIESVLLIQALITISILIVGLILTSLTIFIFEDVL